MQNIIFLDIDGVLNDNINDKFNEESIHVLKTIINKNNAKLVIISSLQSNGTINKRNNIINIFYNLGITNLDFIDPNYVGTFLNIKISSRSLGIIDYLKNNNNIKYIILDDEYHNEYRLLGLNYYKTNKYKGLLNKDINNIELREPYTRVFKYINYKYRTLGQYELVTNKLIKILHKINKC